MPTDRITQLFVKAYKQRDSNEAVNLNGYFDNVNDLVRQAYHFSGHGTGVYFTLNPIRESLFSRCPNQVRKAKGILSATDEDVLRRELLLIDIDPKRSSVRSSTDKEKALSKAKVKQVYEFLRSHGWPIPFFSDSGNGFHLIYRVDLPSDDDSLVRGVLSTLASKFSDDQVEIDTTVYNPVRLCKIPGTMACKGKHTVQHPHRYSRVLCAPKDFKCVAHSLLKKLSSVPAPTAERSKTCQDVPSWLLSDARSYVEKMPEAIAGQHGHDALFAVACRLVIDFDLSPESAFPILQEYNKRCQPPWKESDLLRKLNEADKVPGERGRCVRHRARVVSPQPTQSERNVSNVFHGSVPDYAYIDTRTVLVPISDYLRIRRFDPVYWLAVWQQQTSHALVPDVLLRQCWWGADFPRNWRREVKRWRPLRTIEEAHADTSCRCKLRCPFFGTGVRHQHFAPSHKNLYGTLEVFTVRTENSGHRVFNVFGSDEKIRELRKQEKQAGKLVPVYWPVLIFSDSPRIQFTPSQQRLLLAITRELTYEKNSLRVDRAQVITDRRVPIGRGGNTTACPLLDQALAYVAFGGNGSAIHKGKGYYLPVWLQRAGYTADFLGDNEWNWWEHLFADLRELSECLDLTVAGRHSSRKEWISLDDMQQLLRTGRGREILIDCRVRIFAPEDYLSLWRLWFSHRLGYDWIPRNPDDPWCDATGSANAHEISNAEQVRRFLGELGMTQEELAQSLDCSRERVNRHLNGRACSGEFFQEVSRLASSLRGRED